MLNASSKRNHYKQKNILVQVNLWFSNVFRGVKRDFEMG